MGGVPSPGRVGMRLLRAKTAVAWTLSFASTCPCIVHGGFLRPAHTGCVMRGDAQNGYLLHYLHCTAPAALCVNTLILVESLLRRCLCKIAV